MPGNLFLLSYDWLHHTPFEVPLRLIHCCLNSVAPLPSPTFSHEYEQMAKGWCWGIYQWLSTLYFEAVSLTDLGLYHLPSLAFLLLWVLPQSLQGSKPVSLLLCGFCARHWSCHPQSKSPTQDPTSPLSALPLMRLLEKMFCNWV